jgi:hypothetical protein
MEGSHAAAAPTRCFDKIAILLTHIEHSRLSCGYSLMYRHLRPQTLSPEAFAVPHGAHRVRLRAPPVRARSLATPLPSLRSSDSQPPVPCLDSSVLRFTYVSCMHLSALPFSSGSRAGADHCSPRLNARRQATWMRPCMGRLNHLHIKATPGRSSRPHGRLRRLGNCADERLGGCCLSSLQSLELS